MPIKSFQDAESLIQSKPSDAIHAIDRWEKFEREFVREHNEDPSVIRDFLKISQAGDVHKINGAWADFVNKHPEFNFKASEAQSIHDGLILQEAWKYARSPEAEALAPSPKGEISQLAKKIGHATGDTGSTAAFGPLNLIRRYKYMEDDPKYQEIEANLRQEWNDKRSEWVKQQAGEAPKKEDFEGSWNQKRRAYKKALSEYHDKANQLLAAKNSPFSKEKELDYLFGSLSDPKSLTLSEQAKERFKKSVEGTGFLKRMQQRKLQRYDRNDQRRRENIHRDPETDETIYITEQKIRSHTMARELLLYEQKLREITDPKKRAKFTFEQFQKQHAAEILERRKQIAMHHWGKFEDENQVWTTLPNGQRGKISKRQLDQYRRYIEAYMASFDEETKKPRRSFFRLPFSQGGGLPVENPTSVTDEFGQGDNSEDNSGAVGGVGKRQQRKQNKRRRGPIQRLRRRLIKKAAQWLGNLARQLFMQLGQALMDAFPEVFIPIIIIIILIILIIVIIPSLFSGGQIQLTQLQCGTDEIGRITGKNSQDIGSTIGKSFAVITALAGDPGHPKSATETEAIDVGTRMFDTICILFGHDQGSSYDPNLTNFNNFGTLAVGSLAERPEGGGTNWDALQVEFTVFFDPNATWLNCTLKREDNPDDLQKGGRGAISWLFQNANGCSPYQLQFYIAKALGQTIIKQQAHLAADKHKYVDVFGQFQYPSDEGGAYADDNRLPTHLCLTAPNLKDAYYNCFGDMVGEYISYPYYLDASVSDISNLTPTPTFGGPPTPTPTPTLTPTPPPAGTPVPTQPPPFNLKDYPIGRYSDYYKFAYNNLFNKVDFFVSQSVLGCPTATPPDLPGLTAAFKTWGITVTGDNLSGKVPMLQDHFVTMCLLLQSSKYKTLIQLDTEPLTINFSDSQDCCGFAKNKDYTFIYGNHNGENDFNRFTLAHELTHIIKGRTSGTANDVWNQFDTTVYTSQTALPTYNCQHDYDNPDGSSGGRPYEDTSNNWSECFADAVGLYLTYPSFDDIHFHQTSTSMNDYPTGLWSKYYNFVRNQIFGGLTFFVQPGQAADFAGQIVDTLKNTFGCFKENFYLKRTGDGGWAYLQKADESCIYNANPKLATAITDVFKRSIDDTGVLQCVGFVKGVAAGLNKPFDTCGDAARYSERRHYDSSIGCTVGVPTGYNYTDKNSQGASIQAGDIIIYHGGAGHIAYVTKVFGSGTNIYLDLAEGNGGYCRIIGRSYKDAFGEGGCVDRSTESLDNPNLVGWLRSL